MRGQFLEKLKAIPTVADVTTDQLNAGPMLDPRRLPVRFLPRVADDGCAFNSLRPLPQLDRRGRVRAEKGMLDRRGRVRAEKGIRPTVID